MGMTSALRRIRARAQRSETGFTLIELVISLVLLTMHHGCDHGRNRGVVQLDQGLRVSARRNRTTRRSSRRF